MQVVNELRIAQVCRLLMENDRTVCEIACNSGFEARSHFNQQFRRIMKTTPGRYREQLAAIAAGRRKS